MAEDGIGLDVGCVALVAEVVSPGPDCKQRDRVRKRPAGFTIGEAITGPPRNA
ncbi:hypothetical protein [Streptomyces decoyicus]|uniref:hypothetical protein n=1 Tax=Streptomyces decoyicus TaxID=249567 RepID=UPI000A7DD69B|nr:hypothetical protein [Streptomyces decoyicus]QZY18292.1 hypothetical protein K7C20_26120 [Streptomyces decoyicus]